MITIIEPRAELITLPKNLTAQLDIIELAGRTCYKSEERIKDDSAGKFIKSIVNRGHESVIEHGSVTFKFIGSRSMSHQLVRHRLCQYSQESQRYCNYKPVGGLCPDLGLQVICPSSIIHAPCTTYQKINGCWQGHVYIPGPKVTRFLDTINHSYQEYLRLIELGIPAEDARCYLPNATKTEVVITANFRQWRHMIKHRGLNKRAQWEIRLLFLSALAVLKEHVPCIFGDLGE